MITDRLKLLNILEIDRGDHRDFMAGHCAMETVAWLDGEEHTSSPTCTCKIVAEFVRQLNDAIRQTNTRSDLLRPILPRLIGTVVSDVATKRREYIIIDATVRVFVPILLDDVGAHGYAQQLRDLPEIVDEDTMISAETWLQLTLDENSRFGHREDIHAQVGALYDIFLIAYLRGYAFENLIYAEAVKVIERMLEIRE